MSQTQPVVPETEATASTALPPDPPRGLFAVRTQGIGRFFTAGSGGALAGLILMIVVFSFVSDKFLSTSNFINILNQITVIAILALGQTLVVISGGIDLSVGSVLALSVMSLGYFYDLRYEGLGLTAAAPLALLVGAAAGLVNGLMVTRAKLPPFIATLAMFTIARGIANIITSGQKINGYPDWYTNLASTTWLGFLTVTVIVLIILYVVVAITCATEPAVAPSTPSEADGK